MYYILSILAIIGSIVFCIWGFVKLAENELLIMIPMAIGLVYLYKPTKRR